MMTYDQILNVATGIGPAPEPEHLSVEWLIEERLAIGRDADNRQLLVFGGCKVQSAIESVERTIMHGNWTTETGVTVAGSVLRLHAGEPFLIAVTTVAAELFRRGVGDRPTADVFRELEEFISLVIRRVLLPPETLLGLVGELLVFEQLLDVVSDTPRAQLVDPTLLWQGHSRCSRDFRLGRLGLEVKTTSLPTSVHRIGSLAQIEPRVLDGEMTEFLALVSLGLRDDPLGNSRFSVPNLTESISSKLTGKQKQRFLEQLREYGPEDCIGYEHSSMAAWEPYSRGFSTTFPPRVYDLSDENLGIPRRLLLQQHFPCIVPDSLCFSLSLPETVPGSHGANPQALRIALERLVGEHCN